MQQKQTHKAVKRPCAETYIFVSLIAFGLTVVFTIGRSIYNKSRYRWFCTNPLFTRVDSHLRGNDNKKYSLSLRI